MRNIQAKVKIIFPHKPLFLDQNEFETIRVVCPSEWHKERIRYFIEEATKSVIRRYPAKKKTIAAAKIVVVDWYDAYDFPVHTKVYEWDFDDKKGEWEYTY